jgi:hypothetical protein
VVGGTVVGGTVVGGTVVGGTVVGGTVVGGTLVGGTVVGGTVVGGTVVGGTVVGGTVVGGTVGAVATVMLYVVEATTPERTQTVYVYVPAAAGAVMAAEVELLPVTLAPFPEIQNPAGLLPPVKASATVYAAPAAGVPLLGVAVTEPPTE